MRISVIRQTLTLSLILTVASLYGQVVSISPSSASGQEEITVTFDASEGTGGLTGSSSVYMHSGVVTSGPNGTDWNYVVGNWGQDDGVGQMTPVDGEDNLWEITITPKEYYNVPDGDNIFRLAMVFRNANGSSEGKGTPGSYDFGDVASNGDIFIDLTISEFVTINSPTASIIYLNEGESVELSAQASSEVSAFSISVNDVQVASVAQGTSISHTYTPQNTELINMRVDATINGSQVFNIKEFTLVVVTETPTATLPEGLKKGINYHQDDTQVTLVLEAPGKDFAYVVGDFTDWQIQAEYLMNQTPDGELFWLEINGLTPSQQYVFQYWVDETIKIADPYAELIADPWNDQYITEEIYPNLFSYDRTDYGIASVLQTAQEAYVWSDSENTWQAPAKENLVIYELLVRDFVDSHYYQDVIDSLDYLKRLGVNAIELMPVMEFEGNSSWGYNTSYSFAADKYYGTKDDLKKLIETAHQKGIAVILDIVLNHHFGQSALVQMYWDASTGTVSEDSPWFNPIATHPFNVGFDFNHESSYTKNFVDSVNRYWVDEFHVDGYRFDLSKGFTQTDYGDDITAWSSYDAGRVALLKRMADKLWAYDSEAIIILEHFGAASEETELANYGNGMLLWRGMSGFYAQALIGAGGDISGANASTHVSFMESHDEERQGYEMIEFGVSSGDYDVQNELIMMERAKMGSAFHFLQPGPKMIWQFGELAYDISINQEGRLGEKPEPWGSEGLGYYEDTYRQYVFDAYSAILELRNENIDALTEGTFSSSLSGSLKQITIDHTDFKMCIIGNFGTETNTITANFPELGDWFDYFTGESMELEFSNVPVDLAPGEFHIYTNNRQSDGYPNVVEFFTSPVTTAPVDFSVNDEILLIFDAGKAGSDGTNGLLGANKVYMHAGIATSDKGELSHVVGSLTDDGVGEMTKVDGADNKWQIVLTPQEYFGLSDSDEIEQLGMYFRDATNENVGTGFRGQLIYLDVTPNSGPLNTPTSNSILVYPNPSQGLITIQGIDKV
ncbi:MAG TPA: hypothetical protein DHN29_18805, partial [Cytophagales bacterium]|nr:hypothetical protein [Cytophagales bacterium]